MWINRVNYQPVLHNADLVENLCFVCWVSVLRRFHSTESLGQLPPPPQNLGNSQTSPFSNLISILHVTAESLFTPLKHDKLNKVAVKSFLNKRKRLKKQLKHIRKYVTLFQLWRISQNKAEIPVKWILVVFEAFPYGEA